MQASSPALEQVVAVEGIRESTEPLKPERITLEDVAFLQFTSGSTSRPKGVTLTHGNLAANIKCIMHDGLRIRPEDRAISWLPLYHDMGLIGFVLAPLYHTVPVTYLPALLFLKRPVSWLQAFTRHRGHIAYAPNFGYALCVKRIKPADLAGIDLSSWRVAGCGAEPIRPETLEGFCEAYAPAGFRREAFLTVVRHGRVVARRRVQRARSGDEDGLGRRTDAVDQRRGHPRVRRCRGGRAPRLVRQGIPRAQREGLRDGRRRRWDEHPLPERRVGELRIAGPSVMRGYWEDAERTRESFAGSMLRTGDLGFVSDGHVFVCGRSKEVVIVNGRNYYPQDMEWEAGKVPGVRRGNVVAFGSRDPNGVERDRERVVLAFEVQEPERLGQSSKLCSEVRQAVQEGIGLALDDVVALPPGALPKTSSGKLQRAKTRELYETGELMGRTPAPKDASASSRSPSTRPRASSVSFKLAVPGGRRRRQVRVRSAQHSPDDARACRRDIRGNRRTQ